MDFKRKIGPLPMWAWILIVGVAGGLLWYEHSKGSSTSTSTSSSNQIDPATGLSYAQEQQDQQQGIDPFTGQSYASEQQGYGWGGVSSSDYPGGTGITDTSPTSTPDLATEIGDVVGLIGDLQGAGLIPAPTSQASAPASTGSSSSTTRAVAKKRTSTKLAGGITLTNFKPKANRKDTIKGVGNGLYESVPKSTAAKLHAKTVKPKTKHHHRPRTVNSSSKARGL